MAGKVETTQLLRQGQISKDRYGSSMVQERVPLAKNFILSGSSKSVVIYNSLSMLPWVSGFVSIIREETNIEKNQMFDYLAGLMEDSYGFG